MKCLEFKIEFSSEILERMNRVTELLDISREELVICAVRRFLDKYEGLDIQIRL